MRTALALALLGSMLVPAAASAQARPNVVVFLADDLGFGDIGAYGQPRIRTPRIDALAAQGMRFTQAYAGAPVCAPSRCVLWTGLHGGHCPVAANLTPNATLRADEITIARLLDGAGYRTAIVGKWGLGGELPDGTPHQTFATPWRMGFDESLVLLDQTVAHDPWPAWVWRDGTREAIEANEGGARGRYAHDLFAEQAIAFLERAAVASDEPFFLFVGYTLPHREVHLPPEGDWYAREDWPEVERAFASMVTRLDADVGRVVDRLDALGLADRTLVLVASDNGPHQTDGHLASFFDSSGALRGGKRDLYEGGIRVPMIARWPGTIRAGAVEERPVGFVDVLPTLAELAGIGTPVGVDGTSLADVLRGTGEVDPRAMIWSCSELGAGPGEVPTRFATRDGTLKLIEREDGTCELYDLARDPGEELDLAEQRPAEVEALRARRAAEVIGPVPLVDPILRVVGDGVLDDGAAPEAAAAPVLHLRFDRDRLAAPGAPVISAESAIGAPPLSAAPANGARYERDVRAGVIPATGAANALSVRLDRAARQYLAVPPHPALSFGRASVTIEAWVRLASLGGRQWLVLAKPLGRSDAFVDLGVLVQSEGLEDVVHMHGAARGISIVLGDPSLHHGAWAISSSLAIEDLAWHRVVVRVDVGRGRAIVDLDDAREELSFVDRGHVASSGPLMIGAHHDASGEIGETLDGWIDELRISRGVVPDERLLDARGERQVAEATLDLGELRLGSAPVTRTIAIVNATEQPSRLLEGSVSRGGIDDPRLAVDAPPFAGLASGAGRGTISITLTPSSIGPLSRQTLTIHGLVVPFGHRARRAPLRLHVEGTVIGRASMDAGADGAVAPAAARAPSCAIAARSSRLAAVLAVALAITGRVRRADRRSASRRARATSRASRPSAPTPGSRGTASARRGTTRRG